MSVSIPSTPDAIAWVQAAMLRLGWSQTKLARETQKIVERQGMSLKVQQQHIQNFLSGNAKKLPTWYTSAIRAIREAEPGRPPLQGMVADYRADAPPGVKMPDERDFKVFLPILLRAAIGLDRGPGVDRLSRGLASLLAEIGNRPSLLADRAYLKLKAEDVAEKL